MVFIRFILYILQYLARLSTGIYLYITGRLLYVFISDWLNTVQGWILYQGYSIFFPIYYYALFPPPPFEQNFTPSLCPLFGRIIISPVNTRRKANHYFISSYTSIMQIIEVLCTAGRIKNNNENVYAVRNW